MIDNDMENKFKKKKNKFDEFYRFTIPNYNSGE